MSNPKQFFESIAADYDGVFKKLVSPFPEMLQTMFDYLPDGFQPKRVLELGCGTGNLTKVVSKYWPDCELTVVDISGVMLKKTREKTGHANLKTVESSFTELTFASGSFDLVTSSLAIHHVRDTEKIKLIQNIHTWLTKGGVFMFNDCVCAQSDRLNQRAEKIWIDLALQQGLTDEQMRAQIQHHRDHDHYPALIDLANWLRDAGFKEVDILWRFCIWAVLCGTK